jgi:acetyltransferase-like isoleucine patch superfamily enzyme
MERPDGQISADWPSSRTHIGRGSVIGAGTVVTGEVLTRVLAAGNPAQVLRRL